MATIPDQYIWGLCYLDNDELYEAIMDDLPVLTGAAHDIVKCPAEPAPFHTTTLYTS